MLMRTPWVRPKRLGGSEYGRVRMKVRDLIARLSALRSGGLLDEWGDELVGTLERQASSPGPHGAAEDRRCGATQEVRSRAHGSRGFQSPVEADA